MKKTIAKLSFALFILLICTVYAKAGDPKDSTAKNCNFHLKDNNIFTEIDTSDPVVYGRSDVSPAYRDVQYNKGEDCDLMNDCIANNTAVLYYVVYYPKYHNYFAEDAALPCVIFFHPGGSSDCSNADTHDFMPTMCTEMAQKGFICINVEYRRGRAKDGHARRSVQAVLAQYRSSQDGRGAIRSIIQVERNAVSGAKFKIDTTRIFLAGASAGGLIVNTAAYYSKEMVAATFPNFAGSPTIEDVLGPIDADYYVGGPNIDFQPKILGVLDMWAGITMPIEYYDNNPTSFFTGATSPINKPALISFQGYLDDVFHFSEDKFQRTIFSHPPAGSGFNYNATNTCLLSGTGTYQVDTNRVSFDLFIGSSLNLYNILNSFTTPPVLTELYVDCGMGHGVDDGDDFGTMLPHQADIWTYMVERTAVFFQSVMVHKTKTSLGNSLFIECPNTRDRCSYANDTCTNTLDFCVPLP